MIGTQATADISFQFAKLGTTRRHIHRQWLLSVPFGRHARKFASTTGKEFAFDLGIPNDVLQNAEATLQTHESLTEISKCSLLDGKRFADTSHRALLVAAGVFHRFQGSRPVFGETHRCHSLDS